MSKAEVDIETIFSLIDGKGYGQVGIENVFEFTDTMPEPPEHEVVTKVFKEFDKDSSGEIDRDEFIDLCEALEGVLNISKVEMCEQFTRHQYEVLFELCDDDGGGTIDKSELKNLVESLHGMLGLKQTAADVSHLLKPYEDEELNFEEFHELLAKLLEGRPITQVVRAFKEARRRRKEIQVAAIAGLQDTPRGGNKKRSEMTPRTRARSMTKVCMACAKKELELTELRQRLAEIELSATRSAVVDTTRRYDLSIEPKIAEATESVETAVGCFKQFDPILKCAINNTRSRRLRHVALRAIETEDSETLAEELSASGERCHKAFQQYSGIFDTMAGTTRKMIESKLKFLRHIEDALAANPGAPVETGGISDVIQLQGELTANKTIVSAMGENAAWVLDALVETRVVLCDSVMAAIPFSNKGKRLMEVVLDCERATQELQDLSTCLLYTGSENWSQLECLLDEAVSGIAITISQEDAERLRAEADLLDERIKPDAIEALTGRVKETIFNMQANFASLFSKTRDRGVNTKVWSGQENSFNIVDQDAGQLPAVLTNRDKEQMHSSPPRMRKRKLEHQVTIEHVERLVEKYKSAGVNVPDNFTRIHHPGDTKRHTYQYGSRKIDVVVRGDSSLAVIVGGGFLRFDEFCAKYGRDEKSRLERMKAKGLVGIDDDPAWRSRSQATALSDGEQGDGSGAEGGDGYESLRSPSPGSNLSKFRSSRKDPYGNIVTPERYAMVKQGKGHKAVHATPKQRQAAMYQ